MNDDWPHLSGQLSKGEHRLPVRVYFEDTDFSGVVYHGAYVRFLERGRSDFLRHLGIGHDQLDKGAHGTSLAFAVRRMSLDFNAAAGIDDVLEVRTRLARLTGVRVALRQEVRRGATVLVDALVEVVLIDRAGRLARLPTAVHRLFADIAELSSG